MGISRCTCLCIIHPVLIAIGAPLFLIMTVIPLFILTASPFMLMIINTFPTLTVTLTLLELVIIPIPLEISSVIILSMCMTMATVIYGFSSLSLVTIFFYIFRFPSLLLLFRF